MKHLLRGAALFVLTVMGIGAAEAREQAERLLYDVMFGGLHIADIVVTLDQDTDQYSARMEVRTRGVIDWFDDFRADMTSDGAFTSPNGRVHAQPSLYKRTWSSPEVASELTMAFDPMDLIPRGQERLYNPDNGKALKPEDMPWNNRSRKIPVVPDNVLAGAIDPMAAFVGARRLILDAGQREVRLPIYDGRRRYDIISIVSDPRAVTVRNVSRTLTPVKTRLVPVYGFEADGEDRMRESEGQMFFSTDDRFLPVQIVLGNSMFSSAMNLVADCKVDPKPCDTFNNNPNASGN